MSSTARGIAVVFGAAALAACTTLYEEMPKAPTGGTPVPIPVVVVPVPVPTPVAPAPPPPGPGPAPAPAPAPTPGPPAASCGLGPGPGSGQACPRTGPTFLDQVDAAINQLVQQRPDLFNLNDQRGAGGYRILNIDAYLHGVAGNLRAMGLCAIVDGGGEIAVKNTNSFSDQYDIVLSTGHVFRGFGSYAATCTPAWF